MLLVDVIMNLRAQCPLFGQRVMGTQNFVALQSENSDIAVPCCYIVPMNESAQEPDGNRTAQRVTERFATIVCLDNSVNAKDGRGVSAVLNLNIARTQLLNALIGWNPTTTPWYDTVKYSMGRFLYMTNGRLWYQFEWTCSYFVNGSPEDQTSWKAIDAIINQYWPEVDPTKIKEVFVGRRNRADLGPADRSLYEKILSDIEGMSPSKVAFTNRLDPDSKFGPQDPGAAMTDGHYSLKGT